MREDLPLTDIEFGKPSEFINVSSDGSLYERRQNRVGRRTSAKGGVPPSESCTSLDDLQITQAESLRDQSKKISQIIKKRNALHDFNPVTPDPPPAIAVEQETSGIRYWIFEVNTAKEHGGNYKFRFDSAYRTAVGSLLTFSLLVFSGQQVLGAVWIGNIFMQASIQSNLGDSISIAKGFTFSVIATTAVSWPVGFLLSKLESTQALICLPFFVFVLSFLIMTCPQLSGKNLMILVMYIILGAYVREDVQWWEPLGYTVTYLIGLVIAILMNILPSPRLATSGTHYELKKFENDLSMLLLQCKAYADNTASAPGMSRAAIASIELLQARLATTAKNLRILLSPTTVELALRYRNSEDLREWVGQTEKLQGPLKSLRTALTQRVMGEEYALYNPKLSQAKQIIKEEVGAARDRLMDAMITSVAICHSFADPEAERTVLPDVILELECALSDCRKAFHRAMMRAGVMLAEESGSLAPAFAHLTRRMCAFDAIFELADSILFYLKKHRWDAGEVKVEFHGRSLTKCLFLFVRQGIVFVRQPWLWNTTDSYRLALKMSVGMTIASAFVSVPYLWSLSAPFGIWPGLTIASVNLGNTGSSFHKASDRLFGTLLAAAFALLISDLFPDDSDFAKIPAITVFTFIVIYFKDSNHAYKFTYASTSIGSMLYGSVKNDFNIAGYIPKRIELIFVGVVIFSFVELLMFPRSSRKMIESASFQFFISFRNYLKQAVVCSRHMEDYIERTRQNPLGLDHSLLRDEFDPFQLDQLVSEHESLKAYSSKLKNEIDSGLKEPHIGLSLPLDPKGFRGLVKEQCDCETYAFLLEKSLRSIAGFYRDLNSPIRSSEWPKIHTACLTDALEKTEYVVEWLKSVYPDGRLRPQDDNTMRAVTAAAAFRGLEDVRLRTITQWSEYYQRFIQQGGLDDNDPFVIMTLGVTTTYILQLLRHLQKAGKHLELITYSFPIDKEN